MAYIKLENVSVGYDKNKNILNDFSLEINKGDFVSLLGPSGCGKTTTLKTIIGFLKVKEGKLLINDKLYNNIPSHKRNFGMVFQNYALFPHLTVFNNVAFGLKMRKIEKSEIKKRVMSAIKMVGLKGFENRLSVNLSGGQQQRVGIARAIVIEPDLLLMDEPLSNLDANLRIEMRSEIRKIQKKLGITTIYVTHDQSEAIALSDTITVMNKGKIEQQGNTENIYYKPQTPFVATFMGFQEMARGKIEELSEEYAFINVEGKIIKSKRSKKVKINQKGIVFTRQKNLVLEKEERENTIIGKVKSKIFQGDSILYMIQINNEEVVKAEIEVHKALWNEDEKVYLKLNPDLCMAFNEEE